VGVGFDFERLDAMRVAIDMLGAVDELAEGLPAGRGYIRNQIRRSSNSVVLNLAEGAGEFSPGEKARFYRMARRSATETAAQVLVMERLRLVEGTQRSRELLERLVAMLVRMIKSVERRPS
jgi:four helix bundle protein